ncbi:MAG: hypothetical protein MUC49_09970 [Raineya sp.]|jgi:hypothetical protein|nr:hypothetical protein [Raineya sp.]
MQEISAIELEHYVHHHQSTILKYWFEAYIKPEIKYFEENQTPFYIHHGDLYFSGHWRPLNAVTLITGNVSIDGLLDAYPSLENYEDWGYMMIIGNVTCDNFSNIFQNQIMIEGNLIVNNTLLNNFAGSSLIVYGNLKATLFYGLDIWAEVSGQVEVDYCYGTILTTKSTIDKPANIIRNWDDNEQEVLIDDVYDKDEETNEKNINRYRIYLKMIDNTQLVKKL